MFIIALIGKIGVGKDFIADILIDKIIKDDNFIKLSFGKKLKEEFIKIIKNKNLNDYEFRGGIRKLAIENGHLKYVEYVKNRLLENENYIITDVRNYDQIMMLKNYNTLFIKIIAEDRNNEKMLKESNGDEEKYNNLKYHFTEMNIDNDILKSRIEYITIDNSYKNKDNIIDDLKKIFD